MRQIFYADADDVGDGIINMNIRALFTVDNYERNGIENEQFR